MNEHGASIGASLGPVSTEPRDEPEPAAIPKFLASRQGAAFRAVGWLAVAVALTVGDLIPKAQDRSWWALFWAAVVVNCAVASVRAGQALRAA